MTSPSCPVSVMPGSPSMVATSTNSTSPPAPVTARPVATPGTAVRSAVSGVKRARPRYDVTSFWVTTTLSSEEASSSAGGGALGVTLGEIPGRGPPERAAAALVVFLARPEPQRLVLDRHLAGL